MSYHIEKLADEPIILNVLNEDYKPGTDGESNVDELLVLLDVQSVPVYLISDLIATRLNLTDILQAVSLVTRQYQLLKHRNVRETVIVTDKQFVKAAAEGLSNPLFGSAIIRVFDLLEAALAYVRSQLAAQQA